MSVIHYQKKEDMKFEAAGNGILRAEMLPGMVEGVHTYKCRVAAGTVAVSYTHLDVYKRQIVCMLRMITVNQS